MLKGLSTSVVGAAVAVGCLGACVDAKKRFDEFDDRVPPIDASLVDRPPLDISDIDGTWYLAIAALGTNLHLFATWDITIGDTTATLTGMYQPLSAQPPETPPRLPLLPVLSSAETAVDDTATFEAEVRGTFNGMANPLSGSQLGSWVTVIGTIKSGQLVCGSLAGHVCVGTDAGANGDCGVGSKLPVTGFTFAAIRVSAVGDIPNMPLPPLDHCPDPQQIDAGVDAMVDAP